MQWIFPGTVSFGELFRTARIIIIIIFNVEMSSLVLMPLS